MQSIPFNKSDGERWTQPVAPRGKLRREIRRLVHQANTLRLIPTALTTRGQFLFILGHMRSGSTLLSHILCSSEDVIGFGETHNNYRRRGDLAKLLMSVRNQTGQNPLEYRYVLDKIVGTQHTISRTVLKDRRTKYIFLVREPFATLGSIVEMRRQYRDDTAKELAAFAFEHYTNRLAQLVDLATVINDAQRCLLVTHRELLEETSTVFGALERFQSLRSALREDYKVTKSTGQPGIGDPSPNIRLGTIDRSLPKKQADLTPGQRVQAELCYEDCVTRLQRALQIPSVQRLPEVRHAA
jgi:hypothetical protein